MKEHLSKQELIEFAAGVLSSSKSRDMERHIDQCPLCSEGIDKMKLIMAPYFEGNVAPKKEVKARILRSYDSITVGENGLVEPILRRFFPGFILKTAAVAIVVLGLIWLGLSYFKGGIPAGADSQILLSHFGKDVLINGVAMKDTVPCTEGDKIFVPGGSFAILSLENRLTVAIRGGSTLTISGTFLNAKGKVDKVLFNLNSGLLYTHSYNGSIPLYYKFSTTEGEFIPLGTEFLLSASSRESWIQVQSGRVAIKAFESKRSITASAGEKYFIKSGITAMQVNSRDREIMDLFIKMSEGKYYDSTLDLLTVKQHIYDKNVKMTKKDNTDLNNKDFSGKDENKLKHKKKVRSKAENIRKVRELNRKLRIIKTNGSRGNRMKR